jgi:diacylglycerol O-acyltransferase-1
VVFTMATTENATVTGMVSAPGASSTLRRTGTGLSHANGTNGKPKANISVADLPKPLTQQHNADSFLKYTKKKYRHVAAVHSKPRTSCLSHESDAAPSFLGFRNLMVLVLLISNLRLMLENIRKVSYFLSLRKFWAVHIVAIITFFISKCLFSKLFLNYHPACLNGHS